MKKLAILIPLALLFSWLWIKSNEPIVLDATLITKTGGTFVKYPFEKPEITEGERYILTFSLPVSKVYHIKAHDSLEAVNIFQGSPFCLEQECIIDLTAPGYTQHAMDITLKHTGAEIPLSIQIINHGGICNLSFGIYLVTIVLLIIVSLKLYEKELGKNSLWILRIIFFGLIAYAFAEFCSGIFYEFAGATNVYDTPIFFAMGRAIANGYKYYTDIYEIKPPGFYFLVALVIKIFDTAKPMHFLQGLVLILIAAFPVIAYFRFSKEKNIWFLSISILFGMLIALYTKYRAGEGEIESFGACIALIAIYFMASENFEPRKKIYIPLIAIFMIGCCGMKEPFFFPILASSLLFANNFKTWCQKFLLPFAIACVLGLIILLVTDLFEGYLGYLQYMTTDHASSQGSPFGRMFKVWLLMLDLDRFSWGLGLLCLSILISLFLNSNNKLQLLWKLPIGFILATLSALAVSETYDHHYIFALPFCLAIYFLWIKTEKKNTLIANFAFIAIIIFTIFATFNLPKNNWEYNLERNLTMQKSAKITALYLDTIMDKTNVKRYMVLSLAGTQPYAYTKHSPFGPYVILHPLCWELQGTVCLDMYMNTLNKAEIIVYQNMDFPIEYQKKAIKILEEEFTLTPWEEIADIPQPEGMERIILFRKRESSP
ncbi:MAG: hypothetical protein FWC26_09335 [Fibromonadales bacterium]|nr:hypothetical protein [Fibromonadales bacterium]